MNWRNPADQYSQPSQGQFTGGQQGAAPDYAGPRYEGSPRAGENRYTGPPAHFEDVRAYQVMTRQVAAVHADAPLAHAARVMADCDCGALPVLGDGDRLVGMLTDRDIALRLFARGLDPRHARVADCMTHNGYACHAQDRLVDCMRQMSRHQVRRIPIVDDVGRLVGIVSQADVARHAGMRGEPGERRALADVVCAVSEPTHTPHR